MSSANIFQDFLKDSSADFDINDVCGCSLATEPVTGELVGRQTELKEILDRLSVTLPKESRYPVIQMTTPPGSGKSFLLLFVYINRDIIPLNKFSLLLRSIS